MLAFLELGANFRMPNLQFFGVGTTTKGGEHLPRRGMGYIHEKCIGNAVNIFMFSKPENLLTYNQFIFSGKGGDIIPLKKMPRKVTNNGFLKSGSIWNQKPIPCPRFLG